MKDKLDIYVDVTGNETGQRFEGKFVVKTKISNREALKEDEVRRNILGQNPQHAGEYAWGIASMIAWLAVRLTDSPTWWKEAGGGVDLLDDNVLTTVHDKAVKAVTDEKAAFLEAAEKAKADLAARATADDVK